MSDDTPRTDAERAKTLTPAYEHEGAEWEAWEWAKKLEKECVAAKLSCSLAEDRLQGANKHIVSLVAESTARDAMSLWKRLKWALFRK